MKILIALGGNALLMRGQKPTCDIQKENIKVAAKQISKVVKDNQVIICHGNGPQVGLLALQSENYKEVEAYPFDVLVSQTKGMIGYLLQQQLYNELKGKRSVVSVITQVEVDSNDPAFQKPTKPIGQVYDKATADKLGKERSWNMVPDGNFYRRAIASPKPKSVIELEAIKTLLQAGIIPICSGGGGIPVKKCSKSGDLKGVEAVIDKDSSSSLLASLLDFDLFVIATDVEGVFLNWGKPDQRMLQKVTIAELSKENFSSGSMGPKVEACVSFTKATGKRSVIGSLSDIEDIINGKKGTQIVS